MHNERKHAGVRDIDTIKHHHGNDGKMPRPRPVGSRDNNGKRAADKHYQRSQYAQMFGKPEAIKGNVKMEEVTEPDEERIKNKERNILYVLQRHNAFIYVQRNAFYLLIKKESMP